MANSLEEQLAKYPAEQLAQEFQAADKEAFQKIDCLECANCCKTTGPLIEPDEIPRLAAANQMSSSEFLTTYLEMDEDGDFVMQSLPCPMLQEDNTCKIYSDRPEACRDFPHTARKDIHQYLDILEPNMEICPAVEEILNQISNRLNITL